MNRFCGIGTCGKPQIQSDDIIVFVVMGYDESAPVMEGTKVNYTCPPGLVHSGPTSSTCMQNGEWEPDPREVMCKGKS